MRPEVKELRHVPARAGTTEVLAALRPLATRERRGHSSYRLAVCERGRFWVEIEVRDVSALAVDVRVATTNPPEVLGHLRDVLTALDEHAPGTLVDLDTHVTWHGLDEAAWAAIVASFEEKAARFRERFGPVVAAVPPDQVFDLVPRGLRHRPAQQ
jgi:hypothetical protein